MSRFSDPREELKRLRDAYMAVDLTPVFDKELIYSFILDLMLFEDKCSAYIVENGVRRHCQLDIKHTSDHCIIILSGNKMSDWKISHRWKRD